MARVFLEPAGERRRRAAVGELHRAADQRQLALVGGLLTTNVLTGNLANGGATFAVEARDLIGAGSTVVRNWVIDTVRPTVTITTGPTQDELVDSASVDFLLHATEASQICWAFDAGLETCAAPGQINVHAIKLAPTAPPEPSLTR